MEEKIKQAKVAGWKDGRLGVAFDLIEEAMSDYDEGRLSELRGIADDIESFDYDTERFA